MINNVQVNSLLHLIMCYWKNWLALQMHLSANAKYIWADLLRAGLLNHLSLPIILSFCVQPFLKTWVYFDMHNSLSTINWKIRVTNFILYALMLTHSIKGIQPSNYSVIGTIKVPVVLRPTLSFLFILDTKIVCLLRSSNYRNND